MAYFQLDPFGSVRMDFHAALISWTMASVMSTKGAKPKLQDFFPDFSRDTKNPKPNAKQIFDTMLSTTIAIGGEVITPNG